MVNRTQALVLGFFVVAFSSLLVILVAAPDVYDRALRLPDGSGVAEVAFLAVLTALLGLLAVGVLRRWRWIFWLVQVAIGLAMVAGYRRSGVWGAF
jgi:purine-cytosine permease-like protein